MNTDWFLRSLPLTKNNNILDLYNTDYKWLSQVFESVRPASDSIGKLLWFSLGAQTKKLIHDNIQVGSVHKLGEFVSTRNFKTHIKADRKGKR